MAVLAMKIRDLDLSDSPINAEHQAFGLPPLERQVASAPAHPVLKTAQWTVLFLLLGTTIYLVGKLFDPANTTSASQIVADTLRSPVFWSAVLVGLVAQTVDGALGMAYGITSTSFLLATGAPPAVASASVHIAEVFTTGVSGVSHIKLGNVDKRLFLRLLLPGMVGAVTGAWLLASIDAQVMKPIVAAYLLLMGLYVLSKVLRKIRAQRGEPKHVAKLGLAGGFVDAVGGGGWGPVVTTTLIGTGHDPRMTIGSVNLAEFFLTFVSAIAFSLLVASGPWIIVAGLVVGGLFAAPFAAYLTRRLNTRVLLALVGSVISLVSVFNLWQALA
jgi:uncharacterized membrane protein YfcA